MPHDQNTLYDSGILAGAAASAQASRAAGREARTTDFVRVRLLVAIPVMIVLLLAVMGGIMYQFVEVYFGSNPLLYAQSVMQEFAAVFLLVLTVFAIIGAAVGAYLAYSITQPIREIVSLSARVARGDFTPIAPMERHDEVGQLGSSFNQMVTSLNTFITSRNRFILESFSGGLVTTDVGGTIVAMNSSAEKMLGVKAAAAVGSPAAQVFSRPGTEGVLGLIQEASWKEEPLLARPIQIETERGARQLSANCSPMRDENGKVFGLIINLRDLGELQRFYEQMNRADRLATLGTFAAGLAHEVRNPLGAIKGTAQLLAEDVRSNPRAHEYTQVIVKEVNRLDALVREVQEFSQTAVDPGEVTDLSALVRDTVALARNHPSATSSEAVEIHDRYAALPPAIVSRGKFTQALFNILLNAFQATPPGGRIEVATEYAPKADLPLQIRVSNSGSAIAPEVMARMFEPFFTTKEKGTGLGLPIAYQVIRHYGGEIEASSDSEGVTFTISLPEAEDAGPMPEEKMHTSRRN